MVSPVRHANFGAMRRGTVHEQAARWYVRLREDGSERTQRELEGWLAEDDAHLDAWIACNDIWERIGPAMALAPAVDPLRRRGLRLIAASLVAVALAAVIVAGHFLDPFAPTYATRIGEQRVARLDDGSMIILNTNSFLRTHFEPDRRDVDLVRGEVLFDVARDAGRPFTVRTELGDVVAVGTSFVVRLDDKGVDVVLISGLVDVRRADHGVPRIVSLQPGDRLRSSEAVQNLDPAEIETVTAWRKGEIVFDETPLSDAVAEVNRYSRTPILLKSPSAAERRISGIVRIDDLGVFVDMLADLYGLEVARTDTAISLSGEARTESR